LSNPRACPRKDFRTVFFPRKFFRNSVSFNVPQAAIRYASDAIGCHTCAAARTKSCRNKNRARRAAFGLPQDSHMQLMCEACVNRNSELSAFHGVGFHGERGVVHPARRLRMRAKQLNGR
jgi:hypothetical protein